MQFECEGDREQVLATYRHFPFLIHILHSASEFTHMLSWRTFVRCQFYIVESRIKFILLLVHTIGINDMDK